jgi:hypothetical protein
MPAVAPVHGGLIYDLIAGEIPHNSWILILYIFKGYDADF